MTKICSICGVEKELTCFAFRNDKNKHRSNCLECGRAQKRDYIIKNKEEIKRKRREKYLSNREDKIKKSKIYYDANKDKISQKGKEYREKNVERVKEQKKLSYFKNKGESLKKNKEYRNKPEIIEKNKIRNKKLWENKEYCEKRRIYSKKYRERNIQNKIGGNLRTRINVAVREKSNSTFELLGCDIEKFIKYLESKFTPEMNFDNYGTYWSIDHIVPCRAFDLENEEHQRVCFNYKNCRPMEKIENIVKGNTEDKNWEKIVDLEPIKKQIFGV